MKKLVIFLLLIMAMASPVSAALTAGVGNVVRPTQYWWTGLTPLDSTGDLGLGWMQEVETIIEAWTLEGSSGTITFASGAGGNGLILDNAVDNVYEWTENSESLLWTFNANEISLSSDTGVLTIDFGSLYQTLEEISAPSGNPTANQGWFYVKDAAGTTTPYFEDSTGTVTSMIAGAGTPGGADTEIQYNNGGAFGAIANFIWDDTDIVVKDDQDFAWGDGRDWKSQYDEGVDNQLLFITANTSATATTDPMFEILVGTTPTADQQVFGIAKGTQASNTALFTVDEDGDVEIAGVFYQAAIVAAASGNVNQTFDAAGNGTQTFGATSTGDAIFTRAVQLDGDVTLGDSTGDSITVTGLIVSNVTLDDGTGDSPTFTLTDATNETAAFVKLDNGDTTITIPSDTDFEIATGNLAVGNGSPGTAPMDGEDFYVEGQSEFDDAMTIDGTLTANGDSTFNDQIAVNLNANDEEILITGTATNVTADNLIEAVMAAQDTSTYILALTHTPDADAQNDYLVLADNTGSDIKFRISDGGGTAWTLDAAKLVQVDAATTINTSTAGVLDMDVTSATANNKAIYIDYELDDGGSGTQYGVYIDLDDDAAGGDETFHALSVLNSAGTNATTIGLNVANTIDTGLNVTAGAASVAIAIDAAATNHTGATGVIDIEFDSITDNSEAINIKATAIAGGSGQSVAGMEIELVNDSDNGSDVLYGLIINVTDSTATGTETALYVKGTGVAAALQADFGYIRIGTGASPDVTPGDDDLFAEGTIEVDGTSRFDNLAYFTPVTVAFTTEGDLPDPLLSNIILLDGDNDAESDTLDLQNGTFAGQVLYLIAAADIDADDTFTLNFGDTTATNAPAVVFNKVGENALLTWTGSTWIVVALQDTL